MINKLKIHGFKLHRENRNLYFSYEIPVLPEDNAPAGTKREVILIFGSGKNGETLMSIFDRATISNYEKQGDVTIDFSQDDTMRAASMKVTSEEDVWRALQSFDYKIGPEQSVSQGSHPLSDELTKETPEQKAAAERIKRDMAAVELANNGSTEAEGETDPSYVVPTEAVN